MSIFKKYGFIWATLLLFLLSLGGHWAFGWHAYVEEQEAHEQPVEVKSYLIEIMRDTLENWQSEFLQLLWQVVGLAYFLYLGSPSSHENDDRLEAKGRCTAALPLQGRKGDCRQARQPFHAPSA